MIQNWCCHKNDIDTFNVRILNFRCQAISSSAQLELALWVCKVICSMQILCKMLLLTNLQLVCKSCRTISAHNKQHTHQPSVNRTIWKKVKKSQYIVKCKGKCNPGFVVLLFPYCYLIISPNQQQQTSMMSMLIFEINTHYCVTDRPCSRENKRVQLIKGIWTKIKDKLW